MINPFLEDWDTPFGVPPFDAIRSEHFAPAYKQALVAAAETDTIVIVSKSKLDLMDLFPQRQTNSPTMWIASCFAPKLLAYSMSKTMRH